MKYCLLVLFTIAAGNAAFSQSTTGNVYPRIAGYASIVHPIVAFDKDGSSFNFDGSYTAGFPFGLNLLKNDRIGFSFEFTPTIRSGQGTDKVSNLLFHPGLMFRRKHGFTIIARLAFETAGRFGTTAVFNKIIAVKKDFKYFIAVPVPFRFGNDKPASVGLGLQMGIVF